MKFFLYCLVFFSFFSLNAQEHHLAGQWDGFLVLHQQKYPVEMNLNVLDKGRLSGFTSVSLPTGKVVEMKLKGKLHFDRSVTVREVQIVNEEEVQHIDWYRRNFQLVFKRDLWEMTLEGYWQEQIPQLLDEHSKKGRIFLKKREIKA